MHRKTVTEYRSHDIAIEILPTAYTETIIKHGRLKVLGWIKEKLDLELSNKDYYPPTVEFTSRSSLSPLHLSMNTSTQKVLFDTYLSKGIRVPSIAVNDYVFYNVAILHSNEKHCRTKQQKYIWTCTCTHFMPCSIEVPITSEIPSTEFALELILNGE